MGRKKIINMKIID